jgi:hypothetical protein
MLGTISAIGCMKKNLNKLCFRLGVVFQLIWVVDIIRPGANKVSRETPTDLRRKI